MPAANLLVLLLLPLALLPRLARADVVLDWNALTLDAARVDNSGPTLSTRNLAARVAIPGGVVVAAPAAPGIPHFSYRVSE